MVVCLNDLEILHVSLFFIISLVSLAFHFDRKNNNDELPQRELSEGPLQHLHSALHTINNVCIRHTTVLTLES